MFYIYAKTNHLIFILRLLFFVFTFVICNNTSQDCDSCYNHKDQVTLYANSDVKSVVNQFNLFLPFEKILKKCNIKEFNITYYESEIDAKLDINHLKKPQNYNTSISKKIFVRLDNIDSGIIKIIDLNLEIQ